MSTEFAYIGYEPCGCPTVFIVDNPDHAKDRIKESAKVIRRGGWINRVPWDEAKAILLASGNYHGKKPCDREAAS